MNEMRESSKPWRPHLTKEQRLPKCYKEVEKILKSVQSCQVNFKTALQNSRLRGSQFKKVYKLALNVLKYYHYIQKIIEKTQLLKKEKFLRKEIAIVLIYELIFGNGSLPGESKAVTTVQAYQNDLMNVHQGFQNSSTGILNEMYNRRYVRVHTLVTTVAYVIKDLEKCGFQQIVYDECLSEEKYLQIVKSLEKGNFLVDFHFKDILVFAQDENLTGLDLYKNGHIFLQDKASYIPVHVLNPEPGSTVLDACAAPGMKSAHIAAKMKNKGILIVCERDKSRFETLKETLQYGAVKISKALCTDFKLVDPTDDAYSAVEYILLDPSCSGSGMVNRMDEVTDTEDSKSTERLTKLAGFQIILLKHALKFPSVKRIVYSTCSIHEEENEYVVHEVLNAFGNQFKLVPVMPEWSVRGSENYEYGKLCLRTVPEKHFTNGFFVAMFERIGCHKQGRKNSSVNHDGYSEDIPSENFNSHSKRLKLKTEITQKEKSCEKMKTDETTGKYSMSDNNRHKESSSSTRKKKKYDSCIQQCTSPTKSNDNFQLLKFAPVNKNCSNSDTVKMSHKTLASYKNNDQVVENRIHSSYLKEESEQKTPGVAKHKKKKEKEHETDIQFQTNEQSHEEVINISPESLQKCENSEMLKSFPSPKICNTVDKNAVSLVEKKSKWEKHPGSENKFVITERNCEMVADAQLKHKEKKKKKKHSINEDTSSLTEAQGGTYSSEILESGHQDFDQNVSNVIHSSYTNESKELNVKEFIKHKKKKKGKEYATDKFQYNEQNLEEVPNVPLSELLQKSKNSQKLISSPSKLCEAGHKRYISSEIKSESTEGNYEVSVDVKIKHKKRKREHSTDENAPIFIHTQETKPGNKIDSIILKPAVKNKTNDSLLPCNMQSECVENKSLKVDGDGDSPKTTSVKVKKNKKHKKHSKDSDFTSSQLSNVIMINMTGLQCNSENYSSVNSIENSNIVSHNETMKTGQHFADNSSKCKKNKRHKKHASKSDSLHDTKNINVYTPDSNINGTTAVMKKITNEDIDNCENILVNSANQNDSYVNKKSKNYENEKTDGSPNVPFVDLVQDNSNELLKSSEIESTVDPVQNSAERKSRNKHKKHSRDDINSAKIEASINNESISTDATNLNYSFHSEVKSKNCHKTKDCVTTISQELDHLLSQSEEKLENILFSDYEVKKKKKHKRHYSPHAEDKS